MGQRHRKARTRLKADLRNVPEGWYEDEFGELKKKVSKGEARRTMARRLFTRHIEHEIVNSMMQKARRDIIEKEDARVFKILEDAVQVGLRSLHVGTRT